MADTFQLYDLRVEVICPPGERILCGAKEGDHFILEGEMLHLPPGQGFSIYSLSEPVDLLIDRCRLSRNVLHRRRPAAPRCEAARLAPQ
jgi:uncharacterized repeat protein (TIGR04076 family)